MEKQLSWGRIITNAGAFIALLIGSGFATGQEVMQYFSSYGYLGILGIVVVYILFLYVGIGFVSTGYREKFEKGSDIFEYYCGKQVGKFYDYFSIAFLYMSYIVMIGGSAAAINQQYGLPGWFGGIGMGILASITVVFGLNRIVDIIGRIGPVIVIVTIALGIHAISTNFQGLSSASKLISDMDLMTASSNWFLAAGSYVGFCILWLAAFLASVGKTSPSLKEAKLGATIGAGGFCLALVFVTLGIMANIKEVGGSMVPLLILADNISPFFGFLFSFTVVAGIYTTAVPLLWQVVARFASEKTTKFKILTLVLAIIGVFIGLLLPFDRLVNIIYVINGYVGIMLLVFMLVKSIRRNKNLDKDI